MKRKGSILVFVFILVASWSVGVWADFYVIGTDKHAKRTVLVRPESTGSASGTALLNALAGITDATATNPYLIIIEPGVYNIGTNSLVMKEYVDIEGSGEGVTKITGTIDIYSGGVVEGADNTELRFLTVVHAGGGGVSNARAIYGNGVSPKITNVTVEVPGGPTVTRAIWNNGGSAVMTNVSVTATASGISCVGILNDDSAAVMTNVTASASGGTANTAIKNAGVGPGDISPTMTNVIASASGTGSDTTGVYNSNCASTMTNVIATASGGGVYTTGVRNFRSNTRMFNVTATGSGGTGTCYGLWNSTNTDTYSVKVYNSRCSGDDYSVRTHDDIDSTMNTYIGGCQLDGAVLNGGTGTLKCAVSYNGGNDPLDATCTVIP